MVREIDAVFFDWSGVISDDRMPVYQANMAGLIHYGKLTMSFEDWLPKTAISAQQFFRDNGIEGSEEELLNLYKMYLDEAITNGVVPFVYPNAQKVLGELQQRGKRLTVLSSHPRENLISEATQYGLLDFFETWIKQTHAFSIIWTFIWF